MPMRGTPTSEARRMAGQGTPARRLGSHDVAAFDAPRLALLLSAVLALALWAGTDATGLWHYALLALGVTVLGLPHGALDLRLAQAIWPLHGVSALIAFGLGYLGLAGLVTGLWLWQPGLMLAAFLLYSMAHFAGDWRTNWPIWARGVAGAALIAAPALRWQGEVATIFALLAPQPAAQFLGAALHGLAHPLLALSLVCCLVHVRRTPGAALELALLWLLALSLPPLLYFLVYFCALHSPRHFLAVTRRLDLAVGAGLRAALPLTVLTVLGSALLALLLWQGGGAEQTLARTVFIGLASLTVPHMLLVERFWTRDAEA